VSVEAGLGGSLAVLRRAAQGSSRPAVRAGERCELCADPIGDEHGHLVDLQVRQLLCACRGCHLLFAADGAGGTRYRAVPDRYLALDGLELTAAQWDALQIPVSVAFFFVNSSLQRVAAFYPGPAGATESLLALDSWESIAAAHPALQAMLPDVEALLVRSAARPRSRGPRHDERHDSDAHGNTPERSETQGNMPRGGEVHGGETQVSEAHGNGAHGNGAHGNGAHRNETDGNEAPGSLAHSSECYIVPIDACYELVGQLRVLWRGFDGGREAHQALDRFFENVARAASARSSHDDVTR
jgi:hypothetical protein